VSNSILNILTKFKAPNYHEKYFYSLVHVRLSIFYWQCLFGGKNTKKDSYLQKIQCNICFPYKYNKGTFCSTHCTQCLHSTLYSSKSVHEQQSWCTAKTSYFLLSKESWEKIVTIIIWMCKFSSTVVSTITKYSNTTSQVSVYSKKQYRRMHLW
jgi:hypothetical protein